MPASAPYDPSYTSNRRILAPSPLDPASFASFGQVIQNPTTHAGQPRLNSLEANQGSAKKWLDVAEMENWYHLAKSGKKARSVLSMFVCQPRELREGRLFDVGILERHPYTAQTFVPMGVSKKDWDTRYLVIVAPTLKMTPRDKLEIRPKPYPTDKPKANKSLKERLLGARPSPFTNDYAVTTTPPQQTLSSERRPKGPGQPDLDNIQAFIMRGDQAVTYGPGTWHAPMVVLGQKEMEFVVVQYANGVGQEDCQEINLPGHVSIDVTASDMESNAPGIMRAKL